MRDPLKVTSITESGGAASNGLSAHIYLHKIVLNHATGASQMHVAVYDNEDASGTIVAELRANLADGTTYDTYTEANFSPPLAIQEGISATVTNTGTVRFYYTKS